LPKMVFGFSRKKTEDMTDDERRKHEQKKLDELDKK